VVGGDGPPYGPGDVVVPRGDVRYQGAEHVEGGSVAHALLQADVGGDLVDRHVPRALDHGLHPCLAAATNQLPQVQELLHLSGVRGIIDAPRPEAVPQGQGELVLLGQVEEVVEVPVEGVLLPVVQDPRHQEGPAPGYHIGHPGCALQTLHGLLGDPAVHRHEVHAVLGMLDDAVEDVILVHVHQRALPGHPQPGLVDGHGAHGQGAGVDDLPTDGVYVPACAQVHDGIGAVLHGQADLLQFLLDLHAVAGRAHVDVDLDAQPLPYPAGPGTVNGVEGYDHPPLPDPPGENALL